MRVGWWFVGVVAIGALAVAACGDDSTTGSLDDVAATDLVDIHFEPPDTTTTATDDATTATGVDADDAADGSDGAACVGCFGWPCEENGECNSGWCVSSPSGRACTQTCVESCPDGFSCRPVSSGGTDVSFICIYDHSSYCAPCDDDTDCIDPLSPGLEARCIAGAVAGGGSYCRTPCSDDASCPDGARCRDDGDGELLCRPPDGAECGCSAWAIGRHASTQCTRSNDVGTCSGRRRCDADGLTACGAKEAIPEICNGADDDCDTAVDETFPEDGQACDSDDKDLCQDDAMRCINGHPLCVDAITETPPEVCNGVDDDCDGLTDGEDPDLVVPPCENQAGVCAGAKKPLTLCLGEAGWAACGEADYADPAQPGAAYYTAAGEVACDGRDNDCSGQADEDFALVLRNGLEVSGVGTSCGVGRCAGGQLRCRQDETGVECPSEASAQDETCNGQDDDCDGQVDGADSSLAMVACGNQTGVCAGATTSVADCVDGAWRPCTTTDYQANAAASGTTYEQGVEVSCDGKDNDCADGTDEDFSWVGPTATVRGVGASCGVGACAGGVTECLADESGTTCTTAGGATSEVCNGADDDCDGQTDGQDIEAATLPTCGNKQTGVCAGARVTKDLCVGGNWLKCGDAQFTAFAGALYESSELSCDGKDNDCDGVTETQESTSLTRPACELQLGVCAGKTKPASLCVSGAFGACTASEYGASYSATDDPDASFVDSDCDGIDGDEDRALFVATNGAGNTCTKATPCTLATALAAASASKPHIYLRTGDYAAPNGVTVDITKVVQIWGGFTGANWARADRNTNPARILGGTVGGQYVTLRVYGSAGALGSAASQVGLADLWIIGGNASGTLGSGYGKSSYGLWTQNAYVNIARVTFSQGNGAAGASGGAGTNASQSPAATGGTGGNAEESGDACDTSPSGGGGGVTNACNNGSTSTTSGGGGDGGKKDGGCGGVFGTCGPCSATDGIGGGNADVTAGTYGTGGAGGAHGGDSTGLAGWPGNPGRVVDGTAGAGASNAYGGLVGGYWVPFGGDAGQLGANGGGGGGGGGSGGSDWGIDSQGAGGGGGGAGGCRAPSAGGGGYGGGGSFGVFALDAFVTISNTVFARGAGGAGGAGGVGGAGQPGGSGGAGGQGAGDSQGGGNGGNGGRGGHAGGGGGAAGGVSYGIFWFRTSAGSGSLTHSGSDFGASGTGGGAGSGGSSSGNSGTGGVTGHATTVWQCKATSQCGP